MNSSHVGINENISIISRAILSKPAGKGVQWPTLQGDHFNSGKTPFTGPSNAKIIWKRPTHCHLCQWPSGPVIDGVGNVYVSDDRGYIYKFSSNGNGGAFARLPGQDDATEIFNAASVESLLLSPDGTTLYIATPDNGYDKGQLPSSYLGIYALDLLSGKQKWFFHTGTSIPGAPNVVEYQGELIVYFFSKKNCTQLPIKEIRQH